MNKKLEGTLKTQHNKKKKPFKEMELKNEQE